MDAAQTKPSEPDGDPDRGFEAAMVIARTRWNLTLEARTVAQRFARDGEAVTSAMIRERLIAAVANASPRSNLIGWHLPDDAVIEIIDQVAKDSAQWK
jgi:hypothetical protein